MGLSAQTSGLVLGTVGMLIFSLTLPLTRLALAGDALSPWFVWSGRTVLGAVAGAAYLGFVRAKTPPRAAWRPIAGVVLGVVFGWPLLNTVALQSAPASHAAVVNGILPLATALIGAWLNHERPPRRFWLCAVAGTLVVSGYAWQRAHGSVHAADVLLFAGVLAGGVGYASGAIATRHLPGLQVISWALILGLPGTLCISALSWPAHIERVSAVSWSAFVYLGLMSQWAGFLFWYGGLARGGIARVSQVQLVQLFVTLAFAALLLGEPIEAAMAVVALVTVALIAIGRRA